MPFIHINVSFVGVDAVLAQEDRNIGYASSILHLTERKYSIVERVCLLFCFLCSE